MTNTSTQRAKLCSGGPHVAVIHGPSDVDGTDRHLALPHFKKEEQHDFLGKTKTSRIRQFWVQTLFCC